VTGRGEHLPTDVDLNIVPTRKPADNRGVTHRIRRSEATERRIGEHHAKSEGIVAAIALEHRYVLARIGQFQQDAEVETGRPSTDADSFHPPTVPYRRADAGANGHSGSRRRPLRDRQGTPDPASLESVLDELIIPTARRRLGDHSAAIRCSSNAISAPRAVSSCLKNTHAVSPPSPRNRSRQPANASLL
jgi:hypothetical protein